MGQGVWGADAPRRFFSEKHWSEPLKWNREAALNKKRKRVFCASMADVFERRADLKPWRERLWDLIDETPMLDWLLLTKRPQNIESMARWAGGHWPRNVWLGTTVETQSWAAKRLPHLLKHAASVRFLSCEPLLGAIDLRDWVTDARLHSVNWVIAGGESGPRSRPMRPDWARDLRDQCLDHKIAFHFKQWGHWVPSELQGGSTKRITVEGEQLVAVGKKKAGRKLDGDTWDELPLASLT